MERKAFNHERSYLVDIVKLARAVFELVRQTSTSDTKQLRFIGEVTVSLKQILDAHDTELDPELGQDINEYLLLKIDGEKYAEWSEQHKRRIEACLTQIEQRYEISST